MNKKITQKLLTLLLGCFCSVAIYAHNNNVDDIAGVYTGTLTIDLTALDADDYTHSITPDQILLEKEATENNQIKLTLKDFSLGGGSLGDIIIPSIPVTQNNNVYNFISDVTPVSLIGGIEANVVVKGSIVDGKTSITIDVDWLGIPIPVTFTNGEIVSDNLLLTDVKIDGTPVNDFNQNIFGYIIPNIETQKLTYTKANSNSTVDILLDGSWIYLYVTDGVSKTRYTLYAVNEDGYFTPSSAIKKIAIDQNIDGNVTLTNGAEIQGTSTVSGTITYNKAIDATLWNTIGLPYDLSAIKGVKEDGTTIDITDAYFYIYDIEGKQQKLNAPTSAMIMKLKDNNDNIVSLDLVSEPQSKFEKDVELITQSNVYHIIGNHTLCTIKLSEVSSTNTFYVFNGSKFEKVDASTEIAPAIMYIMYNGDETPVESIDAPDPSLTGITNQTGDKLSVYASNGQVSINNYNGIAEVYVLNGSKILNKQVNGNIDFKLDNGIYIIRTGEKATIVNVK